MRDESNSLTQEHVLRAAVNVLRDSAESQRMTSGEFLPRAAAHAHCAAATQL